MNRGLAIRIVAAAAIGGSPFCAVAADLAPPAPPLPAQPAPTPVAVPYNWNGFFIGGHGGFAWSSDAITLTLFGAYPPGTIPASIAADPNGFLGGVQYGTNWQFGGVVLGTESDYSFTGIRRSQTILTNSVNTGEQKLPWFGTTRVRAGYAVVDNVLVYATGGLASGRAETDVSAAGAGVATLGSKHKGLWGWSAGAGIEYGIGPWSAKIEYLHYDLGDERFYAFDTSGSGAFTKVSTRFSGEIVRVGLNYRFPWTPWQLIFGR